MIQISTLLEVGSLHSENCKIGQKAGSFDRIKNNEEKNRQYLIDWVHFAKGEKEEGRKYRAQSWLAIGGLADWIDCISGQAEHLQAQEVI